MAASLPQHFLHVANSCCHPFHLVHFCYLAILLSVCCLPPCSERAFPSIPASPTPRRKGTSALKLSSTAMLVAADPAISDPFPILPLLPFPPPPFCTSERASMVERAQLFAEEQHRYLNEREAVIEAARQDWRRRMDAVQEVRGGEREGERGGGFAGRRAGNRKEISRREQQSPERWTRRRGRCTRANPWP